MRNFDIIMFLFDNNFMIEEVKLRTKDNITIAVDHYANGHDGVIVIAPGWCMTKNSNAFSQIAQAFTNDFDILSFDFRGHGKSGGTFTFTSKEILDMDVVVKYALAKNYKNIYLMGFSLGGAMVLIYSSMNKCISKVISVSPPTEFGKIENSMWKKEAWWETLKKFELDRFLSLRMNLILQEKIKPIDIIENISAPTLFIAGKKDPTVYSWHTELLYEKAICPKKFKLFENGFHAEDLFLYYKDEFKNICCDWLNRNFATEKNTVLVEQ